MKSIETIAVDIGASNGRVSVCEFDGRKITIREVHRFHNQSIAMQGHLFWDTLRLYNEIKTGVLAAGDSPVSLSIDTPGQDFALMAGDTPLFNIRTYRDPSNITAMDTVAQRIPLEEIFSLTGCKPFSGASLVQLVQMEKLAEKADGLLFSPDLYNFLLCGERACEPTLASTSMMFKWDKWCTEIVNEFGFGHLLPPVHKTGVVLGKVTDSDLCCETSVITGAGHDSAAAVSATPDRDGIFISCGTWSAIGTISDRLITDRAAFENGFTNQRNVEGNKFMTSFSALWILQQCVLEWGISYDKAEQLAEKAAPLERFIDVENELFFQPGQMTARIETFLKATGQTLCTDIGGVTRCILESIAVKYGAVVKKLENLTSRYYDTVCILGGGTRSGLLCGFTAEATGKRVLTGSPESATLGNSLIQLMALGEIEYEEFSKVVSASVSLQEYLPENTELWCEKAILFSDICAMRF